MSTLTQHEEFTVAYSHILRNCQNHPATTKFIQWSHTPRLLLISIGNSMDTKNYSAPSGHDGLTCSRRGVLLVVVSRTMYHYIGKAAHCHTIIPLPLYSWWYTIIQAFKIITKLHTYIS